jgi:histidinol-phosphatase (PHP family)
MLVDYHIHTSRCCHATGSIDEYLAEAEHKGLDEIGFADHFPLGLLDVVPDNPVTMQPDELADYIRDVESMKAKANIPVRLGVEMDYLPGKEKETAALLKSYSFDYVIGSIHFLDGWDFTHPGHLARYENEDIDALYEHYFSTVQSMADSGLFQIIGHLDVVKKFSFFPRRTWDDLMERTCAALKKADVCVELNTSGWRAPVGESYPGEAFLAECASLKIPITLGSDAHCPRDVGSGLQRAALLLDKMGFTEVALFKEGIRVMKPLVSLTE